MSLKIGISEVEYKKTEVKREEYKEFNVRILMSLRQESTESRMRN